jgi:hypothetical protein
MKNWIKWLVGWPETAELDAVATLDHAREYLEQYGHGRNLEYDRARQILALARDRVVNELLTR